MKKLLWCTLFGLSLMSAHGQVALGYFPFNYSQVQLTTNPDYRVFADVRVETNSFLANLNLESAVMVNLRHREAYNLYMGPGLRMNPFLTEEGVLNGYFLTLGTRWMPFSNLRSFGIIFELSPLLGPGWEGGSLRSYLGLSYHFGKKKKE